MVNNIEDWREVGNNDKREYNRGTTDKQGNYDDKQQLS